MNVLVVYDSAFGNTEKIAEAIIAATNHKAKARLRLVSEVKPQDVQWASVVFVGSPTQGGQPTEPMRAFLSELPKGALLGRRVVAFDTRFEPKDHGWGLRLVMRVVGFAAPRIAAQLRRKGGQLSVPPEGFIVRDTEGPLKAAELDRATAWAAAILEAV